MTIFIGTALSTIIVLVCCRELNAVGGYVEGSSQPHWYKDYLNARKQQLEPLTIDCILTQVQVPLTRKNGVIEPQDCIPLGVQPNYIPDHQYRRENNFATRACIVNHITCVLYIAENGTVLGAKLPPPPGKKFRTGDPARLCPDASTSYITCWGKDFEVKENPETKNAEAIRLIPHNWLLHQNNGVNDIVRTTKLSCFGVHMIVHKTTHGTIAGVEFDPRPPRQPQ
ncbi:uncharacterized protein LOC117173212 [Belonocnema kinseyi]|uniref:uncharacterized protein LOC117173212 n=1 Tax=Belonocnema kinseyi TaxID=2817044 RepID=UPI00143CE9B5|nr:uncharacterized protein LOC117173212 [Belonocnema kinseyi]